MEYRLQQYDDGTFGYLGIDGNENYNFTTESHIVCTQGENEDREEFIAKNRITFDKNQYGSNEELDRQVNNKELTVRQSVAEQGYAITKLMYDEIGYVVEATVEYLEKSQLDNILQHKSRMVRAAIVKQRYRLDLFINDPEWLVRMYVADQGYGLGKLCKDRDKYIRGAVAAQGYGLNKLIKDRTKWVQDCVRSYLKKHKLTLEEWEKQYPERLQ